MTPTLWGRIQTRIFLIGVVGSIWTLIITPVVPLSAPLSTKYQGTFSVLGVVLVVGLVWELVWHFFQQFRWEKDWPALFALAQGVPEGIAAWLIVRSGVVPGKPQVTLMAFLVSFVTVWLVTWIFVTGPIRVAFPRWRFFGGRFF